MKKVTFLLISLLVLFSMGPALDTCFAAEDVNVVNNFIKVREQNCKRRIVAFSGDYFGTHPRVFIPEEYLPDEGEILVIETVSAEALFDKDHVSPVSCNIYSLGGLGVCIAT